MKTITGNIASIGAWQDIVAASDLNATKDTIVRNLLFQNYGSSRATVILGLFNQDSPRASLAPPASAAHAIVGSAGSTSLTYHVCAVTPNGFTALTTIQVTNAPATLTDANYVTVNYGAVVGAIEYRIFKSINGILTFIGSSGTTSYNDKGNVSPLIVPAININTTPCDSFIILDMDNYGASDSYQVSLDRLALRVDDYALKVAATALNINFYCESYQGSITTSNLA